MSANTIKSLNISDIALNIEDKGNGEFPIVFIHGFPFNNTTWEPQFNSLNNEYRVIAPDLRGYGKSTRGTEIISISLFADDLIDMLDSLGIKKAIFCGLSMGGYISLNIFKRYPDRCKALILSDTQCLADSQSTKENRYKTMLQIASEGLEKFAESFVNNVFAAQTIISNPSLVNKIKSLILSTSPQTITETLEALATREDTCGILNKINIPTLILCGTEDKITPTHLSEFMHANIKNSTLKIIEHAGHLTNLENENQFNKYIKEFIKNKINHE